MCTCVCVLVPKKKKTHVSHGNRDRKKRKKWNVTLRRIIFVSSTNTSRLKRGQDTRGEERKRERVGSKEKRHVAKIFGVVYRLLDTMEVVQEQDNARAFCVLRPRRVIRGTVPTERWKGRSKVLG